MLLEAWQSCQMSLSFRTSPGCPALLHIKCVMKSDLTFTVGENNVENTTLSGLFQHGGGTSWSSCLLEPSYRLLRFISWLQEHS